MPALCSESYEKLLPVKRPSTFSPATFSTSPRCPTLSAPVGFVPYHFIKFVLSAPRPSLFQGSCSPPDPRHHVFVDPGTEVINQAPAFRVYFPYPSPLVFPAGFPWSAAPPSSSPFGIVQLAVLSLSHHATSFRVKNVIHLFACQSIKNARPGA